MNRELWKTLFVKTLPVMTGYLVLGLGFGILFEKNGYGIGWSFAMSLLVYAGSMQYVAIGLLTSGASLLSAALTTLMVNARHLFYGISMIEKYKGAGKKKPYMIFALTDETYSLVCGEDYPKDVNPHTYCFWISLMNQCYWVLGSVLGSLAGSAIPFDTTGIDFAMTALFVTVFVEQWLSTKNHIPALIGVISSVVCLLIFGGEQFLIPSMAVIAILLSFSKNRLEKKDIESRSQGEEKERNEKR